MKRQQIITWALYCALAGALIFCGVLAYQNQLLRTAPPKIKTVEKEVPVEKIVTKYVKQSTNTATVELITVLNSKIDPQLAKIIAEHVEKSSEKYGLPIPLILSVIRKESNFNPLAVSKAGAVGLMQVMPKIHKDKYKDKNLYHISTNVDVGCQILREYLDKEGTLDKMFHAYLSKNASKEEVFRYRTDIKNYWVKLEMHDYEKGKDEQENDIEDVKENIPKHPKN
jgi:predicted RND superfamily exporter protein